MSWNLLIGPLFQANTVNLAIALKNRRNKFPVELRDALSIWYCFRKIIQAKGIFLPQGNQWAPDAVMGGLETSWWLWQHPAPRGQNLASLATRVWPVTTHRVAETTPPAGSVGQRFEWACLVSQQGLTRPKSRMAQLGLFPEVLGGSLLPRAFRLLEEPNSLCS